MTLNPNSEDTIEADSMEELLEKIKDVKWDDVKDSHSGDRFNFLAQEGCIMAINISALNATEITYIKRDNPLQEYNSQKISQIDMKAKFEDAINNGKATNLLEASGIDTLSIKANPDGPRRNTANYSVDAFFRKDI